MKLVRPGARDDRNLAARVSVQIRAQRSKSGCETPASHRPKPGCWFPLRAEPTQRASKPYQWLRKSELMPMLALTPSTIQ